MSTDDAFNNRIVELIERLIRLTEGGSISWSENDSTSFSYTSPTATVTIESVDKDGRAPFGLRLLDPEGAELEYITTSLASWGQNRWDKPLERLYGVARRNVLNVDKTLFALLNELDRKENEPPF